MNSVPFLLALCFLLFLISNFENPVCSSRNVQSSLLPERLMDACWEGADTALHFHLAEHERPFKKFYCCSSNCGSNYTGTGTGRKAGSISCQRKNCRIGDSLNTHEPSTISSFKGNKFAALKYLLLRAQGSNDTGCFRFSEHFYYFFGVAPCKS